MVMMVVPVMMVVRAVRPSRGRSEGDSGEQDGREEFVHD